MLAHGLHQEKSKSLVVIPNGSIVVFYARYGKHAPVKEQKCLFVNLQYHIFPIGN